MRQNRVAQAALTALVDLNQRWQHATPLEKRQELQQSAAALSASAQAQALP